MVCFEIQTFIIGTVQNVVLLAAHVSMANIMGLCYFLPFGFGNKKNI
jgi:hypothetical protein